MLNRRNLIGFLASLPFVSRFWPIGDSNKKLNRNLPNPADTFAAGHSPAWELAKDELDQYLIPEFLFVTSVEELSGGAKEILDNLPIYIYEREYLESHTRLFIDVIKDRFKSVEDIQTERRKDRQALGPRKTARLRRLSQNTYH